MAEKGDIPEYEAALASQQMLHAMELIRMEIRELRSQQEHVAELARLRLSALEDQAKDHETRLRVLQDGVTQFKVWSGLANGGSSLMALIALARAWLVGA